MLNRSRRSKFEDLTRLIALTLAVLSIADPAFAEDIYVPQDFLPQASKPHLEAPKIVVHASQKQTATTTSCTFAVENPSPFTVVEVHVGRNNNQPQIPGWAQSATQPSGWASSSGSDTNVPGMYEYHWESNDPKLGIRPHQTKKFALTFARGNPIQCAAYKWEAKFDEILSTNLEKQPPLAFFLYSVSAWQEGKISAQYQLRNLSDHAAFLSFSDHVHDYPTQLYMLATDETGKTIKLELSHDPQTELDMVTSAPPKGEFLTRYEWVSSQPLPPGKYTVHLVFQGGSKTDRTRVGIPTLCSGPDPVTCREADNDPHISCLVPLWQGHIESNAISISVPSSEEVGDPPPD